MTNIERECRHAWANAAAMWLFRDFWAEKRREMKWLAKVRKECIFDSKVLPYREIDMWLGI